jgi:penicillin-binding protein 1A
MGRDDARPVAGLQGGTAPARAFAAYMKYAVRDRPVEQFNTQVKLPDWQLEPDDEQMYGNPDDYYYIDEGGNLVEPQHQDPASGPGPPPFPVQGEQAIPGPAAPAPRRPPDDPGQAASDDFLDRATGASPAAPASGSSQRPRAPVPPPSPSPRPQP